MNTEGCADLEENKISERYSKNMRVNVSIRRAAEAMDMPRSTV